MSAIARETDRERAGGIREVASTVLCVVNNSSGHSLITEASPSNGRSSKKKETR